MATTSTAAPAGTLINYRVEGGIAWIEMNDPPANTYTHEMMVQLDTAILRARFDGDVHVIILRGAGDKFFSAGANIKMLASVTPEFKYYFCLHANETLTRFEQTPKLALSCRTIRLLPSNRARVLAWPWTSVPRLSQPSCWISRRGGCWRCARRSMPRADMVPMS